MLLMHWCCWCSDVVDVLICWCTEAADVLMPILIRRCWCTDDNDGGGCMWVVGVVVVVGVLHWDHDQDQLADLSSAFCSSLRFSPSFVLVCLLVLKLYVLWKSLFHLTGPKFKSSQLSCDVQIFHVCTPATAWKPAQLVSNHIEVQKWNNFVDSTSKSLWGRGGSLGQSVHCSGSSLWSHIFRVTSLWHCSMVVNFNIFEFLHDERCQVSLIECKV